MRGEKRCSFLLYLFDWDDRKVDPKQMVKRRKEKKKEQELEQQKQIETIKRKREKVRWAQKKNVEKEN